MSIWINETFDFNNATFRTAKTATDPDRIEVVTVREIEDSYNRIASYRDRRDMNGRLPSETRVWRTRTGNKLHLGYNHSYCGVRANIEITIERPDQVDSLAKRGTFCQKCFGPGKSLEIHLERLRTEAQRRLDNAPLHRGLCMTLAASYRMAESERKAGDENAWRRQRAIRDALDRYWKEHGLGEAERQAEAERRAKRQAERVESVEVNTDTGFASRDLEVTVGSGMRQTIGLSWAEAERLHALLGEALKAHRAPSGSPVRVELDADGMTAEGREALAKLRKANDARQERLKAQAARLAR